MHVHDHLFNANEWSILIGFCIGLFLVFILPKRFPAKASFVFFMCGVHSGFFFDNSLSIEPFDFYDVNDVAAYEFMDYVLYFTYGPISYLFFYLWDCMGLKSKIIPLYVFIWALISLGLERISTLLGVFHYLHGYKLEYSMPIYLGTFSLWMLLHRYYRNHTDKGTL